MADHKSGFLKGAAIGAIIASVATLFLAPKSGKKVRTDVTKLVNTLSKRIIAQAKTLNTMSQSTYEELVARSVADYAKGKKLTKSYMGEVSGILNSRWKEVQKELKKK